LDWRCGGRRKTVYPRGHQARGRAWVFACRFVNPAQVRAFAQALGKRAKTDPIDAAVIAHFAEATNPQVRPLPDAMTQLLAELVARRRPIVEMIAAESQRNACVALNGCAGSQ